VSSAHLPSHWTTTTLLHIVTALEAGKSFRCIEKPPNDEEPGVVKVSAVSWGAFNEQESKTCPSEKQFNPNYQIHPGDLLISRANTIELVGACVIVGSVSKRLMLSDKILRILVEDELKPWILWYLRSRDGRAQIEARSTGNQLSMRNIGQASLLGIQIPLAPARERFQVVEAIESYLTRLDDALATMERVQRNLKRYRASVLKAAVEGRLTPTEAELAHAEGRDYEPASVLLERILTERRRRWEEAELAKLKAKGKVPKNDKWNAKYVEPAGPDTSELPELPEGWCWSSIDQLSELVRNGYTKKPGPEGTVQILRISAVRAMSIDFDDCRWLAGEPEDYDTDLVHEGDLLFTRYNGTTALVGVSGLARIVARPTVHPDKIIKVRPIKLLLNLSYIELSVNTGISRRFIESRIRTTAGQAGVSGGDVKRIPVPLPPLAEQNRIIDEQERILAFASSTSNALTSSRARGMRLRQSILKWAFEGRLVAQDPNDEPAEVLLERIRAERAAQTAHAARSPRQAPGAGGSRR
jgi:type I restriction enzyme, S subunit